MNTQKHQHFNFSPARPFSKTDSSDFLTFCWFFKSSLYNSTWWRAPPPTRTSRPRLRRWPLRPKSRPRRTCPTAAAESGSSSCCSRPSSSLTSWARPTRPSLRSRWRRPRMSRRPRPRAPPRRATTDIEWRNRKKTKNFWQVGIDSVNCARFYLCFLTTCFCLLFLYLNILSCKLQS